MDPAEIEKSLEDGRLAPVYLLYGQDVFQRDRMVDRIAESVPEESRDFNLQTFIADDASPAEAVGLARTMPFISERRVVILRGVDRYGADDLAPLNEYIQDPNDRACLVLVAGKIDARLKFFKALKSMKCDVEFQVPKGRGLVAWLRRAMEKRGQTISGDAAQELIDRIGTDLTELDQELEKVSLYALEKGTIGVEEVRAASRTGQTATVFKLGDAVGEQNPGLALAALKDLMLSEYHLVIFAMLARHFRLLLKARILIESRAPAGEAARYMGVPPFAARNYMNQARGLELNLIKKGLVRLLEANLTLVTSQAPERLVMDSLVLDLAMLRPNRRTGL